MFISLPIARIVLAVLLLGVLLSSGPIAPAAHAQDEAASVLGNPLQPGSLNRIGVTGSDRIRLFGPWRAKDSGALLEGFADIEGGSSAQTLRLVVYALSARSDGYAPGRLVATSDPVSVGAGQRRGWVRFRFPAGGAVARDTRYGLGIWFVGSGGATLWAEDRMGSRWDIDPSNSAPSSLALRPFTDRDEGLPGIYTTLRVAPLAEPAAGTVRLTPEELPADVAVTNQLSGPHRWLGQTVVPGFPPGSAYRRFTWDEVEGSTPGSYDWDIIRDEVRKARERGELYAFRVRARINSYRVPAYLDGRDFNDPYFRERHAALHRAMREEFGDDPDIAWVDLDGPGNYGEWAGGDWGAISQEAKNDVARYLGEIWRDASVLVVVCTPNQEKLGILREAIPQLGFRNDIWGSEGTAAQLWSGKDQPERMAIIDSGERNLLLTGELDSDISRWSPRTLHMQVLWFGPHSISNGNFKAQDGEFSRFSADEQAELKAAFNKLGYRLLVSAADVPATIVQGRPTPVTLYWHNRNVTVPVGKDIGQAYLRLVNARGEVAATFSLGVDVHSLRPTGLAPHVRPEQITVRGLPAGAYQLQLQVVQPTGRTMNLANAGRTSDGAYPLGTVNVAAPTGDPDEQSGLTYRVNLPLVDNSR